MQRWNGWGGNTVHIEPPLRAQKLLREIVAKGNAGKDCPRETFITSAPRSRLPHHPLISSEPKKTAWSFTRKSLAGPGLNTAGGASALRRRCDDARNDGGSFREEI